LEVLGGEVLARARHKGFREILLGTVKVPKDSEKFDLMVPAEKAQSRAGVRGIGPLD